jgi:hypothetical protein
LNWGPSLVLTFNPEFSSLFSNWSHQNCWIILKNRIFFSIYPLLLIQYFATQIQWFIVNDCDTNPFNDVTSSDSQLTSRIWFSNLLFMIYNVPLSRIESFLIQQTSWKIEVGCDGMVRESPSKTMIVQLVRVTKSLKSSAVLTTIIQEIHSNEDDWDLRSQREIFGKSTEINKQP